MVVGEVVAVVLVEVLVGVVVEDPEEVVMVVVLREVVVVVVLSEVVVTVVGSVVVVVLTRLVADEVDVGDECVVGIVHELVAPVEVVFDQRWAECVGQLPRERVLVLVSGPDPDVKDQSVQVSVTVAGETGTTGELVGAQSSQVVSDTSSPEAVECFSSTQVSHCVLPAVDSPGQPAPLEVSSDHAVQVSAGHSPSVVCGAGFGHAAVEPSGTHCAGPTLVATMISHWLAVTMA